MDKKMVYRLLFFVIYISISYFYFLINDIEFKCEFHLNMK